MKAKIIALLLLFIAVFSLCSCEQQTQKTENIPQDLTGDLNVHFIDVGQGDCTLLESDGKFVLIDAGDSEYSDFVCEYLKRYNVKTIDYVIATHPHSDHYGGLKAVINTFDCKNFITAESDQQTVGWLNVLYAVDENNVNYIDAKVSDTYTFGKTTFEILAPVSDNYENYNNYSVVIKATCSDSSFLFMGDAEKLSENEMLDIHSNKKLKCDVLRVGHHGSHSSTGSAFLKATDPHYAVISCGISNDYGHPHKEVTSALNTRNITTYRTDRDSTVIASVINGDITFYCDTTEQKATTSNATQSSTIAYIGNKNSKKFHLSDCSGAQSIKEKNKVEFSSYDEAVNNGYTPCKTCNP